MTRSLSLLLALPLVGGCFWGSSDSNTFFTLSAGNVEVYEGLLYPAERAEAWAEIFEARPTVCPGGGDCGDASRERSDVVDLFLPYETSRGRGLLTQKGDLQLTFHLDVGDAYKTLGDDGLGGWGYMLDEEQIYGAAGSTCAVAEDGSSDDRTGIGRCLHSEVGDNIAAYEKLDEDLRLVLLVNLLSDDDVRSTECQDALERPDWDLPKTLKVNYNAIRPNEADPDVYAIEETAPLAQCDIEVFSRMQLGIERFNADWYGQEAEDPSRFTLDRTNDAEETILGTVELTDLVLPGEDGDSRAAGRFNIRFTSDRFSARDGKLTVEGEFDVSIRTDPVQIDEPERQTDLLNPDDAATAR